MLSKGTLSSLYDEAKVVELENLEELTEKEEKKLNNYKKNQFLYGQIIDILRSAESEVVYLSLEKFVPVLESVLQGVTDDKDLIEKVAEGLSQMDKKAEIQRDKKGNVIYDKETKDLEIVKWDEKIEDYMMREVLPHIPDAKAFFDEDLSKKKPIVRTGAEIPFTQYFYKYQPPEQSEVLKRKFLDLQSSVNQETQKLFD